MTAKPKSDVLCTKVDGGEEDVREIEREIERGNGRGVKGGEKEDEIDLLNASSGVNREEKEEGQGEGEGKVEREREGQGGVEAPPAYSRY